MEDAARGAPDGAHNEVAERGRYRRRNRKHVERGDARDLRVIASHASSAGLGVAFHGQRRWPGRSLAYRTSSPVIVRPISIRWISDVPSKIVKIFASRCQRSTGYSRV